MNIFEELLDELPEKEYKEEIEEIFRPFMNPEKKKSRPKPTPILYVPEYVYTGGNITPGLRRAGVLKLTPFEEYLEYHRRKENEREKRSNERT